MKKFFTLLAMTLAVVGAAAETLINYPSSKAGIYLYTSDAEQAQVSYSTVKIHENADSKDCIKFGKSYKYAETDEYYYALLYVAGGFKAGDVIKISGAYNNADEKNAAIAFYSNPEGEPVWTTENFINGRTSADDPAEQTFTLTEDAEALYIGRSGNTGTNILTLKVVRGEESGEEPGSDTPKPSGLIDYPTSVDGITVGGTCTMNDEVKIHANKDAVKGLKFANGYTTEGAINANFATLKVDGGFKAGDVITLAGVFNNADDTKQSAVTFFTGKQGEAPVDLWTSELFINGRTAADDPATQSFTLEADYPELYLGRANGLTGATATFVTLLTVTREGKDITVVGNTDLSTPWWTAFSPYYTIPANYTLHLEFVNHTSQEQAWHNFVAVLANLEAHSDVENPNYREYAVFRADNYGWGTYYGETTSAGISIETTTRENNWDWDDFSPTYLAKILEGAYVKLDIIRDDATIYVNADVLGNNGQSYYQKYSIAFPITDDIVAFLSTERGYLEIDNSKTVIAETVPAGIAGVAADKAPAGAAYNLAGQKVGADYKGVVIQNGKKLLKK